MIGPHNNNSGSSLNRIDGIYDTRTLKSLEEEGIAHFGFDFRVKATSFLQQYKFLDILKTCGKPWHRYYLIYSNEKDFVITKMVDDLKDFLSGPDNTGGLILEQFCLEFADAVDVDFCEKFNLKFSYHYNPYSPMNKIINSKLLNEIVISYQYIDDSNKKGQLFKFAQIFHQLIAKKDNLRIVLACDWDNDLLPSLLEYFDIDYITVQINSKVEVCYRNVDLKLVKNQLRFFSL